MVLGLGRWGSRAPFPPGDQELGVDALVLALKTLFDADAAGDLSASYELRFGEQRFDARVAQGRFEVRRGSPEAPDATVEATPGALTAVLWHGRRLAEAVRSGDVTIEGSSPALKRFPGLFPAPAPAPAVAR